MADAQPDGHHPDPSPTIMSELRRCGPGTMERLAANRQYPQANDGQLGGFAISQLRGGERSGSPGPDLPQV